MNSQKILYDPKKVSDNSKILSDIEDVLKISTQDFIRVRTTSTAKYITDDKRIEVVPKTSISGHDVKFITDVKHHFSNLPLPERLNSDRPFYEYFVPISTYTEIENVWEIDLNAAYWSAALQLRYINDKFYDRAFSGNISKKARLIGVGVLGKKTVTTEFKYPYENIVHIPEFDRNRVFWDNIVYTVGETMREAVKQYKPHIYGMWFDALFVDGAIVEPLRKFLKRRGFEISADKLSSYIVKPRKGIVPGASITRVFANGHTKKGELSVNYLQDVDKHLSFEEFISKVAKSIYL